jgi:hypothetical protein
MITFRVCAPPAPEHAGGKESGTAKPVAIAEVNPTMTTARRYLTMCAPILLLLALAAGCGGGGAGDDQDAVTQPDTVAVDDAATDTDAFVDRDVGQDTDVPANPDVVTDAPVDTAAEDELAADLAADLADDDAADDAVADPGHDAGPCPVGGCFADGSCLPPGTLNPLNPCEWCEMRALGDDWKVLDQEPCGDGVFCNGAETCNGNVCTGGMPPCVADVQTCQESEARCCTPGTSAGTACNADGNVQMADDCGNLLPDFIWFCAPGRAHPACRIGQCNCADGWTGQACDRCVRYVRATGGSDANAGDTWATAFATVQAAIEAAVANTCEVWVAAGTYRTGTDTDRSRSFQMRAGIDLYGGFEGVEWGSVFRNIDANPTILSGDIGVADDASDNAFHVVWGADATLDGFTITGGNADGAMMDHSSAGGGMINNGAAPIVRHCTFTGNWGRKGGAIFDSGYLTLASSLVVDNSGQYGQGMYSAGRTLVVNTVFNRNSGDGMLVTETATIVNSTFYGNAGAGIALSNPPGPTVRNSILWGNGSGIQNGIVGADAQFNLVQGGYPGDGNIATDPLFFDVQTDNLSLGAGSPAIDWGRTDALPLDGADLDDDGDRTVPLPVDRLGQTRVAGKRVDLGAYESQYVSDPDPVSCLAIHGTSQDRGDGVYWIDWDGADGEAGVPVFCDMTNDGGGWTRVVNIRGDSQAHVNSNGAVGDVSAATAAAKLSDAAITGLNTVGHWRYNCGAGINAFVRNDENSWSSFGTNDRTWRFDTERDGTDNCTASRANFVFSSLPCGVTGYTNYGSEPGPYTGCFVAPIGWSQDGNVWAR